MKAFKIRNIVKAYIVASMWLLMLRILKASSCQHTNKLINK